MIEGNSVIIRTIMEQDIDEIFRLDSNYREKGEYWPSMLLSESILKKQFHDTGLWCDTEGKMVITDKNGCIIGRIGYFKNSTYQQGYELGYLLYRNEDRGKGYMTEALRLFTAYLFTWLPLPRLQLCVVKGNTASRRVAEKCGYQYEGTLRHAIYHRGEYADLEQFSIIKEECPKLSELLK